MFCEFHFPSNAPHPKLLYFCEKKKECGNGELNGTSGTALDFLSKPLIQTATHPWCTKYNTPYYKVETQQHFARMWYDLLVDSPNFLGLVQGESDPYTWTLGQGKRRVVLNLIHSLAVLAFDDNR